MIALLRWTFTPDRLYYWRAPDRWVAYWLRDGQKWTERSELGQPFYGWE